MEIDKKIQMFIEKQKNLTFGTAIDNIPHCVSCFYAYMSEDNFIVFKSDKKTRHIANALVNDKVAGTIIPDVEQTGTVRGIQFTGKFKTPAGDFLTHAKNKYYGKFPFALAISGDLWVIELLSIKMTDNTLGFGKKLSWEKQIQLD